MRLSARGPGRNISNTHRAIGHGAAVRRSGFWAKIVLTRAPANHVEEIMSVQRRDFLLLVALAAGAAVPASAQTGTPSARPAKGGATLPGFSGLWSHPALPRLRPPASRPRPAANRARPP